MLKSAFGTYAVNNTPHKRACRDACGGPNPSCSQQAEVLWLNDSGLVLVILFASAIKFRHSPVRIRTAEHVGSERSERKVSVRGAVANWLNHLKHMWRCLSECISAATV